MNQYNLSRLQRMTIDMKKRKDKALPSLAGGRKMDDRVAGSTCRGHGIG